MHCPCDSETGWQLLRLLLSCGVMSAFGNGDFGFVCVYTRKTIDVVLLIYVPLTIYTRARIRARTDT